MNSSMNNKPLRVFLWVVPRTNSTVFTKCMSFVDNTEVWMEPFMACYMNETFYNPEWGVEIPQMVKLRAFMEEIKKKEEFLALKEKEIEKTMQYTNVWLQDKIRYPWLKQQLELHPKDKQFVFIKDQSSAINDHLEYLPDVPTRHTFLIRHPQEMYPSLKNMSVNNIDFAKLSWDEFHIGDDAPHFPMKELFQTHCKLWKYVKKNLDPEAIIIDGFDLTSKPDVVLPKYFQKLGIPYKDSYLHWESDPEIVYSSWKGSSEFVITASKTTATSRAVESTCFDPPKKPRGTSNPAWKMTEDLKECIAYSMPYYEEMYANRLT
ncbi:hypothetical protein HOLleu_14056 [Holothuria leucospilota]|uniref:Sulfotransferase n=1 Tax=Holothuria leucospilota TaxID=206669 RepID=A0A9Q1C834_HOLLE|nr:hypothetical protein HOLleu_14056 [Holothuria leucospilota]